MKSEDSQQQQEHSYHILICKTEMVLDDGEHKNCQCSEKECCLAISYVMLMDVLKQQTFSFNWVMMDLAENCHM
jgi:hypothetical protein